MSFYSDTKKAKDIWIATFARDKGEVQAALLTAEMAAYY